MSPGFVALRLQLIQILRDIYHTPTLKVCLYQPGIQVPSMAPHFLQNKVHCITWDMCSFLGTTVTTYSKLGSLKGRNVSFCSPGAARLCDQGISNAYCTCGSKRALLRTSLDIGWQLLASFTGNFELLSLLPASVYLCLVPILFLIRTSVKLFRRA